MPTTVSEIKAAVKLYLQASFPAADNGPLASGGDPAVVDTALNTLILLACNNARKFAELRQDWVHSEERVKATITAGGRVALTSWEGFYDAPTTYEIKSIEKAYIQSADGGLWPVDVITRKDIANEVQYINEVQSRTEDEERYRPDSSVNEGPRVTKLVRIGDYLAVEPPNSQSIVVVLDIFKWFDDYTADASTDFFIEKGTAFMMFAAMCEANLLIKQFVPRQEGNLPPPTGERDTHFAALVDFDNFKREGGVAQDFS